MVQRTQISLDPVDHRLARQRAADLGISLAEYVRRLVKKDLGGPSDRSDPSALFALGKSEGSDVRRNKDEYIADAMGHR